MRSISFMFGSKPSDNPPSHGPSSNNVSQAPATLRFKKPSRLFGTISRKVSTNASIRTSVAASDQAPSSGSSSTGCNSLPTPGDDEALVLQTNSKVPWKVWLGGKKSGITKKPSTTSQQWVIPRQAWRSRPPPVLKSPPSRRMPADDTEDETSSESEDESEVACSSDFASPTLTLSPLVLEKSRTNLQLMTENSLQQPFSPPPLLFVPGQPVFPRSCNLRHALYPQESMESRLHRTRLLRHLDSQMTRAQELSVVSFGKRTAVLKKRPSLDLDENAVPDTSQSRMFSQGLQRWASRPCFEDRMNVWVPEDDNLLCTRVAGPSLGVAALEISEHIDILAGAVCEESDLEPPSSYSSSSMNVPIPSLQVPNAPSLPSPLRIEHCPSALPPPTPVDSVPQPEARAMPAVSNVKRGVRFVEDDKEDQIPLGYVLRIRKRREEKAKFLQEEKERRAFELEKAIQEEERAKREAERREWERERLAWEKEKRAKEEERKQRQYAEEVTAARLRRDAARSGFYASPSFSEEGARPQLRESKSSRFAQDLPQISTRRQASDPVVLTTASGSPYSASPVSSNPPSNGDSPTTSGFFSRPSSIHSANTTLSSAEDVLQNRKMMNKRGSLGADSAQRQAADWNSSYFPPWSNVYGVPPLPSMPTYNVDMPLLPPTPPFMMHQNRRSHSPISNSNNRSSSSRHKSSALSPSSSSDRISLSRPGSMRHHRRGSSDDVKRTEKPSAIDRKFGSAVDIHDPRLSTYTTVPYAQQQLQPSRSPSAWAASSLPRNARDRPPTNWRQSVIN